MIVYSVPFIMQVIFVINHNICLSTGKWNARLESFTSSGKTEMDNLFGSCEAGKE